MEIQNAIDLLQDDVLRFVLSAGALVIVAVIAIMMVGFRRPNLHTP
jgi:hypothetical protein